MKKNINIGVIILNYFSYKETINCIESFKQANSKNVDVKYVIVDNGSRNESYEVLCKKYDTDNDINILKLDTNIGFARGNNEGCKFLNEKYKCDYYIFSNSDILVPKNIFTWICETYSKNDCDILGPDIYAPKLLIHQNPIKKNTSSVVVMNLKIVKKKVELLLLNLKIIKKKIFGGISVSNNNLNNIKIFDCPVHGSFIITSNKFLNYYDAFFDDRTFLYMEEYLLYLRCKKVGLKTMVSLDNSVTHLQGQSTDTDVKNIRKRTINRIKREIESMKIYVKVLKEVKKGEDNEK